MRRVPETDTKYLVVGNGRLAGHIVRYLALLNIPFRQYTRQSPDIFQAHLSGCNRVLVLINDKEIVNFIKHNKVHSGDDTLWIHCSGLISTDLAESAHPLASFSDYLFDVDFYTTIPFITEKGRRAFAEIMPGFPNPHVEINKEDKALYHAMCVLSGNFSTILWMEFEKYLVNTLQVPGPLLLPYLKSVGKNLEHATDPLTGPLKRNDFETIERNIQSLEDSPLKELYTAFADVYSKTRLP